MKDKWPMQKAALYASCIFIILIVDNNTTLLKIIACAFMAKIILFEG